MFLSSWLRYWKGSLERRLALRQSLRRRNTDQRRLSRRPALEALEDRQLLSTITLTVNTTFDDALTPPPFGTTTLRDAIQTANNDKSGNNYVIDFNIPTSDSGYSSGTWTISLIKSGLTLTANNVLIDGLNGPSTSPSIVVNGSNLTSGADGLLIKGFSNTVSGLIIEGFKTNSLGALGNAIELVGNNNVIGGTTTGAGNVLSGNANDGILIDNGSTGTRVFGNFIGTDTTGSNKLGNSGSGIEVAGTGNTIGGVQYQGFGNLISGNVDGILIDQNATANAVLGNFIGTDSTAHSTTGLGNSDDGIKVLAASNTIGGAAAGLGNVIDGSTNDGIFLGASASGVLIERNYIGVDNSTQSVVLSNGNGIEDAGSNNTIGVAYGVSANVISGNKNDGILLDSTANHELIQGNLIGVGATLGAVANSGNGIHILGSNNTVGGTTTAQRNYIAANSGDGVFLDIGANSNGLEGNYIGTTPHAYTNLGNSGDGVEVAGSGNVIGGATTGATNVIGGNGGDGIHFDNGGSNNTVQNNYVGCINYTSTQALPNSNGIVDGGGGNNLIGGLTTLAHNFISGNTNDGVLIGSGVSGDVIEHNYIGTNAQGTAALSNSVGVEVLGNGNTIGGSVAGALNVISGNKGNGVLLGASGNVVSGNYIGLKADGQGVLGNSGNGIEVSQSHNTIGGAVGRASNYIAGNSNDGILFDPPPSNASKIHHFLLIISGGSNNLVTGNYIGLNVVGAGVANSNGIEDLGGSNTIGGTTSSLRNYISGNTNDGILIGTSASNDVVQGNYIGLNPVGTAAVGNSVGVQITGTNATLGGAVSGARNIISGNKSDGVLLGSTTTTNNMVQGNWIGLNAAGSALGNSGFGVNITSSGNTIGGGSTAAGNVISANSLGGVNVSSGSGNTISHDSIFANGAGQTGPGIVVAPAANNGIQPPTITSASYSGNTLTVQVSFTAASAGTFVLEFFGNPSVTDPEGQTFIVAKTVSASAGPNTFTFTITSAVPSTKPVITATLTDPFGDTSAFSNGYPANGPPI